MTANGEKISAGAAGQIDEAISQLLEAQRLVANLQRACTLGGVLPQPGDREAFNLYQLWHKLETIDDRIHEALSKLGN